MMIKLRCVESVISMTNPSRNTQQPIIYVLDVWLIKEICIVGVDLEITHLLMLKDVQQWVWLCRKSTHQIGMPRATK